MLQCPTKKKAVKPNEMFVVHKEEEEDQEDYVNKAKQSRAEQREREANK